MLLRESWLADEFVVTWILHSLESSSLTDKTERVRLIESKEVREKIFPKL